MSLWCPGCRCSLQPPLHTTGHPCGDSFASPVGNGTGRAAGAQARGEPNWAADGERNQHSFLALVTVKGQTSPLRSPILIQSHFNGGKKAQHIDVLPRVPKWNVLFQLCCLMSFLSPEGFCARDRAWPQQEHTQAMQERKADPVPKGRARSPRPGLANLRPLGCLQ